MDALTKKKNGLLPAVLLLFFLEVILFPFAIQTTYADKNSSSHHVLTYTTGKLVWDSNTHVDTATGAAKLSLFDSTYQSVQSENGEKLVAPGTEGTNSVQLKNDADSAVQYIAVMYRIKEESNLPVEASLTDDAAFTAATNYPLPDGVAQEQVVSAVTGTVNAHQAQNFEVKWQWAFYTSDEQDIVDTQLGNKAATGTADDVTVGLYIVVEEEDSTGPDDTTDPEKPDGTTDPEKPDGTTDPEKPDGTTDPEKPDGTTDPEDPDTPPASDTTADPNAKNPDHSAATNDGEGQDKEGDTYIYPKNPETGDDRNVTLYVASALISMVLIVVLVLDWKKEKQC